MASDHPTPEDGWFAGFFDGEGYVKIDIRQRDSHNIGYEMSPKIRMRHAQVAGSIDAEGCIAIRTKNRKSGYGLQPTLEVSECDGDRLMEFLKSYCESRGVNCNVNHTKRDSKRSDQYTWSIGSQSGIREFLNPIRDLFIVKQDQVSLLLDEILPRLENGVHHDKLGFLETMYYVDKMNQLKGGNRGKYNLEYFEEEWGMSYDAPEAALDA